MKTFLASWCCDLRARLDFRNLLDAQAAQAITADIAARDEKVADVAYSAEQANREADRLLSEALADGRITAAEIPAVRTALRHVNRSADANQKISEALQS